MKGKKKCATAPRRERPLIETRLLALGALMDGIEATGAQLDALGIETAGHFGEVWRSAHEEFVTAAREYARARCASAGG